MPCMDDTSDMPGQQLAGGYRGHGEPFHPQRTYTSLNAGQGDLLAESCNTYVPVPGVHQWGEAAEGSSTATANISSYATGDDLDPDAEPNSLAGKARVCTPNYLNFKRHAFRQEFDQCNSNTDGNRQITTETDGDGFGANGEKLRLRGPRRQPRQFSNDGVIIIDANGDGFDSNGDKLAMASFQALGARRGCSYGNAEPRSPSTDSELRTSSVAGEFNLYYPYASSIQSVWTDSCARVFKRVVDKLRQPRRHLYIALDLEFVAGASTNMRFRPICWNTWYDHLRTLVNGGEMLQVGLALAFDDLDLDLDHQHGGAQAPSSVIAMEINLKFNVDARDYNDASITFLANQGHCFAEYRDAGVTTEQLLNGLLNHIPFGNDSVTWLTFHGDNDFGFLVRLLQQQQGHGHGVLPPDRADFMRQVRQLFPVFYDVRVLGQLEKEWFTGGLTALAELLGVRRIGGKHHAGSDALLTLSCFKEIQRQHKPHRLDSRRCLLSGMEELDMGIKCARHIDDASVITFEVRGHNFEDQARLINELVTSNFKIVGVDVQLPKFGWAIPFYSGDLKQDYDLIKIRLEDIETLQVTIGFMNAEGMLAYGRLWKFYLSSKVNVAGGNNAYVRPGQLAWLMASCGATHNPNVAWVTFRGSHGIACLIKSFLAADDLPIDWCSYIEHQSGVFPGLYDVGLIAQGCPDTGKHTLGLGMLLAPQALLVLRCYKRLAESPWFPHISGAVRGQLMASWSCFWY